MKKSVLVAVLVITCSLFMLQTGFAGVEWTLKKQLDIEASPRDIVLTPDGQWMIALVKGKVLIYSTVDNKIISRIPVDAAFDKLSYSVADNTLLVASRSGRAVKIIQLEKVYTFSLADLPFKGLEDAPVTVAIFSDYQ
jgi:hypothetical protein